jgi:hypothetical protein
MVLAHEKNTLLVAEKNLMSRFLWAMVIHPRMGILIRCYTVVDMVCHSAFDPGSLMFKWMKFPPSMKPIGPMFISFTLW